MASDKEPPVRRSAGMRGQPPHGRPAQRPTSPTPKARAEPRLPERVSTSRYAKPKVLMGEVTAPRGQQIGQQRDAFRAFMLTRHLPPSDGARAAGVAPGEIMAFLTGHARTIPLASLEKLASAANCT